MIFDISLPLKNGMITYPKNPAFEIEKIDTGHSQISRLVMGSHTGTHIDAPSHVISNGRSVDQLVLEDLIGPCTVLDLTNVEHSIGVADLEDKITSAGSRILAKTKNSKRGFDEFYDDYIYLSSEAAELLVQKQVKLFGIDYLSVKKRGGINNAAHTSLLLKNIPIFEGLDLSQVEPGEYTFIGLPLKIVAADGAPARAILLRD